MDTAFHQAVQSIPASTRALFASLLQAPEAVRQRLAQQLLASLAAPEQAAAAPRAAVIVTPTSRLVTFTCTVQGGVLGTPVATPSGGQPPDVEPPQLDENELDELMGRALHIVLPRWKERMDATWAAMAGSLSASSPTPVLTILSFAVESDANDETRANLHCKVLVDPRGHALQDLFERFFSALVHHVHQGEGCADVVEVQLDSQAPVRRCAIAAVPRPTSVHVQDPHQDQAEHDQEREQQDEDSNGA